jgi:uncharacterized membrane protein
MDATRATTEEVVMHPMLISALADEIVRERWSSGAEGVDCSFASERLARRGGREPRRGFRLALPSLRPRRAS